MIPWYRKIDRILELPVKACLPCTCFLCITAKAVTWNSSLMPQSHTHLRTLRMVRKARPQLSVHSVTIRISSAENVTRNLPQGHFHPRPNFEKYQKSSADENNAMMRNARQEHVSIRILSVSHSHLNVSKPIIPQSTHSCGLVRFHSHTV